MHQLILITAMSATTGLFGGGKHCGKPHHGKKAVAATYVAASPCGASYASPMAHTAATMSYPSAQRTTMAPRPMSPAMTAPSAPVPMAPAPPPVAPTPSSPPPVAGG